MENMRNWKTWLFLIVAAVVEWAVVRLLDAAGSGISALFARIFHSLRLGYMAFGDLPYKVASGHPGAAESILLTFVAATVVLPWLGWKFITGWSDQELGVLLPPFAYRWVRLLKERKPRDEIRIMLKGLTYCLAFLALELTLVALEITSTGVMIRSIYEDNLEAIAPYITEQQRLEMQSKFVQVDSKADFIKLVNRMQAAAANHDVRLRSMTGNDEQ